MTYAFYLLDFFYCLLARVYIFLHRVWTVGPNYFTLLQERRGSYQQVFSSLWALRWVYSSVLKFMSSQVGLLKCSQVYGLSGWFACVEFHILIPQLAIAIETDMNAQVKIYFQCLLVLKKLFCINLENYKVFTWPSNFSPKDLHLS